MHIPEFIINGMHIEGKYYYPTFFFESIWCLIGFIILMIARKNKNLRKGFQIGFYFIWYGIGRFFIEAFRTDSLMFFGLKIAQIVSLIGIIIGIIILLCICVIFFTLVSKNRSGYKTTNDLSDKISFDLKKRGMKFVGSTIIYSYLQAIGIINSHEKECFKYIK